MSPGQNNERSTGLQELARRAAPIARNAHLRSINLRHLEVALHSEPTEEEIPAAVYSEHSHEHTLHKDGDQHAHLNVRVHFDVTIKSAEQNLLTLKATFSVEYDLNRGMPESAVEDLPAFAATNTIVHIWPYYRELVQSMAWRMGLPPFPLPLFRVVDSTSKPDVDASKPT